MRKENTWINRCGDAKHILNLFITHMSSTLTHRYSSWSRSAMRTLQERVFSRGGFAFPANMKAASVTPVMGGSQALILLAQSSSIDQSRRLHTSFGHMHRVATVAAIRDHTFLIYKNYQMRSATLETTLFYPYQIGRCVQHPFSELLVPQVTMLAVHRTNKTSFK